MRQFAIAVVVVIVASLTVIGSITVAPDVVDFVKNAVTIAHK